MEYARIKSIVDSSLSWVCSLGYEESTIEMFHEELVHLLEYCIDKTADVETLHEKLNEEHSTSDYCTWYLRVLTASQMKSDPDTYLPYLLVDDYEGMNSTSGMDVSTFCSREVEPMNRECGMVQVAALAGCLGVRVKIEYMDGRSTTGMVCHEFGEGNAGMEITLLYRPGHYDILY